MTWFLTAALVVIALAIPFVLSLVYAEVEDVQAGTLDYWLGVPEDAKSVPIVTGCGTPLYSGLKARGPLPRRATVSYKSESTPEHVRAVVASAFEAEGCEIATTDDEATTLTCTAERSVRIVTQEGSPCGTVYVEIANPD